MYQLALNVCLMVPVLDAKKWKLFMLALKIMTGATGKMEDVTLNKVSFVWKSSSDGVKV